MNLTELKCSQSLALNKYFGAQTKENNMEFTTYCVSTAGTIPLVVYMLDWSASESIDDDDDDAACFWF